VTDLTVRVTTPDREDVPARPDDEGRERIQKVLARAGFGSRRACERLIATGRVTVDGALANLGDRANPEHQRLAVDGVPVVTRPGLVYYLLNKPPQVVTTARDPEGRPTVVEFVPAEPRVFPVGRLDFETEGLLLLTNDGELAQLLTHPSHGVEKTYLAEVTGPVEPGVIRALRDGIDLDDGRTAPARVHIVQAGPDRSAIELTIHEGRNRQVRRMCAAVGLTVRRLVRTHLGSLHDSRLAPGTWRALSPVEVRTLYTCALAKAPGDTRPSH
jgi:23S rRNA pseudouridine2605 synthase